jgi:hypothetical protein
VVQVKHETLHLPRRVLGATLEHRDAVTAAQQGTLMLQLVLDTI